MYSSLLSPGERDADHPVRGSLFPAFATQDDPLQPRRQLALLASGLMLLAATAVLLALR